LTQIFPLLPGSPALDAGTSGSSVPATDQRGIARVGTPDIGAFESQGFTVQRASGDGQSAGITQPFANPLTVQVSSAHNEPVDGGQMTFTARVGQHGSSATLSARTVTIANGQARVTATANDTVGDYFVVAQANALGSVVFHLTNTAGSPARPSR
jgi:hypothetical protein